MDIIFTSIFISSIIGIFCVPSCIIFYKCNKLINDCKKKDNNKNK